MSATLSSGHSGRSRLPQPWEQRPLKLGRPQYKAKADLVYEELRRAIMDGTLAPGYRLVSEELAARFQVSRMPVRDAIRRLQLEGLVDAIPHCGATVAMVSEEQMRDVFALRERLEGLAASLAAQQVTDDEIAELRALFAEMEQHVKEGDRQGQLLKNREFHDAIFRMSGNSILCSFCHSLMDSVERYRPYMLAVPDWPLQVLAQHRNMLGAIARHDAAAAEAAATDHIQRTRHHLARCAGDAPDEQIGDKVTSALD